MMRPLRFCVSLLLLAVTAGGTAFGQSDFGESAFAPSSSAAAPAIPDFLQGFQASPGIASASVELGLTGGYRLAPDERSGILTVTAEIPARHHIFSLTQKPGATGVKSKLTLVSKDVIELGGEGFVATPSAHPVTYPGLSTPTEEHTGRVEWTIPFRVADGVELNGLPIRLTYDGQICRESDANGEGGVCLPPIKNQPIEATFEGTLADSPQSTPAAASVFAAADAPAAAEDANAIETAEAYRAEGSSAAIEISISPRVVQPGEQVTLSVKAVADKDWHVYALEAKDPKKGPKPTLIVVENPEPWMTGAPRASVEPILKKSPVPALPDQRFHDTVTWTWTWTVPKNADPGLTPIVGLVGYQTCKDDTCQAPLGLKFSAQVAVGAAGAAAASEEIAVEATSYSTVAKLAVAQKAAPPAGASAGAGALQLNNIRPAEGSSLWMALGWAFLGGLILNVMPCVLPVLGLKVYSFVEMAGESRAKVFWHNVAYIFGLLVVFWALGTVAILFQTVSLFAGNATLTLAMIGIVFAMALSFLGLWEIPIPGFSGTSKIGKLADKESLWGAFFKGVIATILATPCGAPLMSLALTQIFGRSPLEVYLIFTCIGIGMAFPYFVIALNPQIIAKVLPKPGAWMIVFKQALAFLLLGTVAWLVSTLDVALALPSLVFVFGIWLACWIVGTAQHHYYGFERMIAVYGASSLIIAVTGAVAFSSYGVAGVMTDRVEAKIAQARVPAVDGSSGLIVQVMLPEGADRANAAAKDKGFELPWEPYSFARLQELVRQEKTVVVDFTADWCPNCKVLEATVLNTKPIKEKVDSEGIVTLVADYTERPAEVDALLKQLTGSDVIPVLAIFPAGNANEPIVLNNGYTTASLLADLDKAGPSRDAIARKGDSAGEEETVAVMTSVEKAR
ncbi:MAG TPA: thioredoxin family protein [Pirellulaceae bacterium]|jgi:thiol:disulfide interchange protein|nr:thioredoxin family protein [Pirellulaceae bacterium]